MKTFEQALNDEMLRIRDQMLRSARYKMSFCRHATEEGLTDKVDEIASMSIYCAICTLDGMKKNVDTYNCAVCRNYKHR